MILNHDLRTVTKKPLAKLNKQQKELLEKNALEEQMMTNVFLYGSSGTGKTILGAEIVKIKLSKLMANKKDVTVIVAQYRTLGDDLLLQNLKEKYFKNIDS